MIPAGAPGDRTDPYVRSLGPHIDALEIARSALPTQPAACLTILRLAEMLERSSEQHGFLSILEAARAVRSADPQALGAAADQLLNAMLASRVHPERQQTILVVDDDPALTRLMVAILKTPGRHVLVATTAVEILDALASRRLDLMLLDVGLPDLDGRMVLASLRKNPLTAALPVIVISASNEAWVEAECLALGAAAFVAKPFDPLALGERVTEVLARPPAAPAPPPAAAPAPPPIPEGPQGPAEVLLAEPDPLIAQIIRHRLTRDGMVVRHFASGTAALQAAQNMTPSLVILDAMLPGIEGIELLVRLRVMARYQKVPILVLSDIGSEREVVRALGAGADDCIRKPFSPTELMARIERLL
ncbi:MAG TPA: response regulator, partial [Gemmatimonadales bacterium]|nr:response regulator [Gemmatimonadales bacterium]